MAITVRLFQSESGEIPSLDWMSKLDRQSKAKILARLEHLAEFGHQLRRPHCENLGDGIYELRARNGRVQLRLLYFFFGQTAVIISHGLTKEDRIPEGELEQARRNRALFLADPRRHTAEAEL